MYEAFLESLNGVKSADLHLHSKDLFDSDNNADRVCARAKELGATAIALTQHGVASQVEAFKKAAKKYGLKFIPGIEAYFKNADEKSGLKHIILLSLSDKGWRVICRAISETQDKNGLAVFTEEDLWKFFGPGTEGHGEVIATTACISGIVADVILTNKKIDDSIEKKLRRSNAEKISQEQLNEAGERAARLKAAYDASKKMYDDAKVLSGKKTTTLAKKVAKMPDGPEKNKQAELLARAQAAIEKARQDKPALQSKVQKAKKAASAAEKELSELYERQKKYMEIVSMADSKLSDAEIWEKSCEAMNNLREIFGEGNLYAEVQYHGLDTEKIVYPMIARIARHLGVPIVATNDVHIVDNTEEELRRRRMLRSLRFNTWSEDSAADRELYIKTDRQMAEWLLKILPLDVVKEAIGNINVIVDKCDVKFEVVTHYPKYISRDGRTPEEVFDQLVWEEARRKFPAGIPDEYRKRLCREIEVMKKMGFVSYHLIVYDFLRYARLYNGIPFEEIDNAPIDEAELIEWKKKKGYTEDVGVSTGDGRGSAVGSLVCQMLNITMLDPILYNLLFERFLNPERVTMPDIDSDISRKIRPRVIEYVKRKYGADCVCGIMTQNAQAPKGAVRNAARCYGLYLNKDKAEDGSKMFLALADQIAKKIPTEVGISFDSKVNNDQTLFEQLLAEYKGNKNAQEIIRWARTFEGCFTAYGAHAAGIVITDGTPVSDIVPLRWNEKLGIYTTQCNMVEVEENGMLKFDFLGLKTLDIMNDCLWQLHKEGISVDIYKIPLDDEAVYREIFAAGRTDSVFQFESSGMKAMLKRFGPTCIEDLIILVSMFRPGPLQYLDDVIEVKNGRKEATFLTPELKPILGTTYSAITYQEQVMRIFQDLAGYTLGGADLVRRAMSKKKLKVLEKERQAFVYGDPDRKDVHGNPTPIKGCVNNGIEETAANALFDQMTEFAKYAFNKSHAAAYAYNAYITGYLKYHYPAEFLMAAMNWAEKTQKKDPIPGLMAEAEEMGVEVCAPDINISGARFTTDGKKIFFGLSAVKTVGASADEILKEREKNGAFKSFPDFYKRCRTKKNAVENLIYAGAFDEFTSNREQLARSIDAYKTALDKLNKKKSFITTATAMVGKVDGISSDDEIVEMQLSLGLHKELTRTTTSDQLQKRIDNAQKALEEALEEYENVEIAEVREDPDERMNREHELLGAYVTAHPMDRYPEFRDIEKINNVTEKDTRIYGVISAMEVKRRKKDGKEMCFLTVEDHTGKIKANLFTEAFLKEKEKVALGKIVVLEGKTQEERSFTSTDDEEKEKAYEFIVSKVFPVEMKKEYVLHVSSYAIFYAGGKENRIRTAYRKKYGAKLYVYDETLHEMREMSFLVDDRISELPGVTINK